MELGCSREDSFRVSTVPEGAVFVSSEQRWWKGAIGDALQLGTGAAPSTIRAVGPGSAAHLLLPQRHSGGCHPRLAVLIATAIRCHSASQDCQQHSGQLENIHPPSLCTTTQSTGFTAPGSCRLSCSPGRSHLPAHSRSQSLVEYLGLQLVRQEGVSNTGNAHPIGSGWLHTAPLPSATEESASATLPPHMVTYNTSGFSFSLLSLMCLIFLIFTVYFLLCILEAELPQIFQGTTISGVKKDLHIPCFTNKAIKAFWVPDSTWAEPECSLYISYQIQFLKGEEVSLIALIKECV